MTDPEVTVAANPEKLKLTKDLNRPDIVFALARLPGGGRVLFGGSDGKVYDLDWGQKKPEPKELGVHGVTYVTGLALAGKLAVSGGYDGRLVWWDVEGRRQVRAVEAHRRAVRGVAAGPDGRTVASVADDMVCRLWDVASGKLLNELRGHREQTPHHFPSMLYAVAFAPDGRHLVTADKVGHVVVWDAATGKQAGTLEAPGMYTWDPTARRHSIGGVRALAFSPDGKLLAAGGIGKIGNIDHLEGKARVEVFDWSVGRQTHEFYGDMPKGLVERLTFAPGGNLLVGAGGANDGFLLFFDLAARKIMRHEKVGVHVHGVALDETGEALYLAGHHRLAVYGLKG